MKKTVIIFFFAFGLQQGLVAVEEKHNLSKQELQEQLQKMESDMKEANEYHNLEQSFKALEEEKTQEAEEILQSIEETLDDAVAEKEAEKTMTEPKVSSFDALAEEIINEPALQENVENAQEKIEDIELK